MSGQSAALSLKEAKAMQVAIQHPSSNEKVSGGPAGKGGEGGSNNIICSKAAHQGKG